MQNRLVLLLGGNLGDRDLILSQCMMFLKDRVGAITSISALYETEPWGFDKEVPLFWNCAVSIETERNAFEVLKITQQIERELGRTHKATEKYLSRVIDVDIMLFNDDTYDYPELTIPHKGIPERRFALVPLNDMLPEYVHPVLQKTIAELLALCADNSVVRKVRNIEL